MTNYVISQSNLDRLLQLSKSAQATLSIVLQQAQGASEVTIDRSNMSNAEKQKLKRGLQDLTGQKILRKVPGSQGRYQIDTSVIANSSSFPSTSSAKATNKKQKEPYGNKPEKQVNMDKLLGKLKKKQDLDSHLDNLAKQQAEIESRMRTAISNYRLNRTHSIDSIYDDLTNKGTSTYLAACEEFIDEVTNETHFYDIDGEVIHENKLMDQFHGTIASYDKRHEDIPKARGKVTRKRWNILIELDAICTIAKHSRQCLELAAKNQPCSCCDKCRDKFQALIQNKIDLSELDDESFKEHKELNEYFQNWVSKNYSDLFV